VFGWTSVEVVEAVEAAEPVELFVDPPELAAAVCLPYTASEVYL
jgi:hypothetical protein